MHKCKGPCGKDLPEDRFGLMKNTRTGKIYLRNVCKTCRNGPVIPKVKGPAAPTAEPLVTLPGVAEYMAAAAPLDPLQATLDAHRESTARRDMGRENRALIQELGRKDALITELTKGMQTPQVIVYEKAAWERSDAVCVAMASDWHIDEPVDAGSVHGRNEYNLEIARSRAEHFFKNVLKLTDKEARDSIVRTIVCDLIGDFFSGWIHEELIANTLLAPGDAMLFARELIIAGIEFWLRESSYVLEFNCVPGNHGRMTKQMHFGDPSGTSLESVMYATLADRFHDNPRVRFNNPGHAMIYRTYFEKFVVRIIHGYEVKYGGGVGGVTIPLNKAIAQWDILKRADNTEYGHFHQFLPGSRSLGNGSLIGYNLFAQAIKAGYEEAMQAFYVIHARNGGTRAGTFPVWLDDKHRDASRTAP